MQNISHTRFGLGSSIGSTVSTDSDMGLQNLDPRIWVLLMKMDLDPGPPRPGPYPACCHPYSRPTIRTPRKKEMRMERKGGRRHRDRESLPG